METDEANTLHACRLCKNTRNSKQEAGQGAGESRRALSLSCDVALSGRLSGVLSASSVDRFINVVGEVGEGPVS